MSTTTTIRGAAAVKADARHLRRLRALLGCADDALAAFERAARQEGFRPTGDLQAAEESAKRLLVYLTGMDGRLLDRALDEMRD